jgi:hypothetical protein
MATDDLEFADRLDRFLDELAVGPDRSPNGPPADHELADTVRRLRVHDDAIPPDPRFADRLLEDLMRTATDVVSPPFQGIQGGTTGRSDLLTMGSKPPRQTFRPRWAPTNLATAALVVLALVASVFAFGPDRPGRSDDAPALLPAVSGTPADLAGDESAVETLVTTIFPMEALPTVSSPAFLIWYATIDPETEADIPPEPIACCPGPQIAHLLAGELALRVDGPLQVQHASPDGTQAAEEIAPGTEVVLQAGDTAIYSFELPATYRNAGPDPVHLLGGGLFAGSPPNPPVAYAIATVRERYPAPVLPPGPLAATLQRATLAPGEIFPAPPPGSVRVVTPGPELGTLGERGDGSAKNLGEEPVVVYALTLHPITPNGGTPAAG